MFSNRIFQVAFLVSFIAHGVVLFQNVSFNFLPGQKKEKTVEFRYVRAHQAKLPAIATPAKRLREPFLKIPDKITVSRNIPSVLMKKEDAFSRPLAGSLPSRNADFAKPLLVKPDIIAIKKKISLPPIDMDKINNPSYISYYQILREKIKRAAYQNCAQEEVGQVYITFVISSYGILKDVRISDEKSSPNSYLREIALRSVKDASPFPNFPRELDYSSLSFNVLISFETE
jgi:TonB family protein